MEQQNITLETRLLLEGYKTIAGVDIQGMGAIAGPLVITACILPITDPLPFLEKKLMKKKKDALLQQFLSHPHSVYSLAVLEINTKNLFALVREGILQVLSSLSKEPDLVLINGALDPLETSYSKAVLHGTFFSQSIAYAELLAKHTRNSIMEGHDTKWPEYGFLQNHGYPTPEHKRKLHTFGPSPIHHSLGTWPPSLNQESLLPPPSLAMTLPEESS